MIVLVESFVLIEGLILTVSFFFMFPHFLIAFRFHNKEYAPFTVFQTEKKGFGLKAITPLIKFVILNFFRCVLHLNDCKRSQFVIEYCGEVVSHSLFLKRAKEYSEMGAKHFYFMSIKSDEVLCSFSF